MDSIERIRSMIIKEFIQIFRDPKMRAMIFLIPLIQTIVFGYAVTTDVKNIRTTILDQDNSITSRNVINDFSHSGYFNIDRYITSENEINYLMDSGKAMTILHFPKGFEEDINSGKTGEMQTITDGTDANTAGIIQSYISKIVSQTSQTILIKRLVSNNPHQIVQPEIKVDSRAWFNPNLESPNFYVPGLVATLVTLLTLTLTSMAIVREKEIGTMEQIMVTPISRLEFILGKSIPFIMIGFIDVVAILIVAVYWFKVPIHGNLAVLFLGASLYLLTTLGIGLIISSASQTQQQAMMSAFGFYFPVVLLSGFIFPVSNMPTIIQYLTYFNPMRYFLVVIRGVFLKGIGWEILWPQMLALGIMGLCTLIIASKTFRKTMS